MIHPQEIGTKASNSTCEIMADPNPSPRQYIDSIQIMRGLAALLVVFQHNLHRFSGTIFTDYLGFLGDLGVTGAGLGEIGVTAFFVISGMVLPLSLGGDYRWKLFPMFLFRRAVRIEPTYLASVVFAAALIFVLSSLAPQGVPTLPSLKQLALHALYLIPFSQENWIQGVYWTLAVEFQFYLCIGLIFPVIILAHRKAGGIAASLLCSIFGLLVLIAHMVPQVRLFQYATCFAIGMLVAGRRIFGFGLIPTLGLALLLEILGAWSGQTAYEILGSALAATVALFCTGPVDKGSRWIKPFWFLGTISYSLYVMHQVIASAAENVLHFLQRRVHGTSGLILANLVPVGSLIAAFLAAYLLYRLVEMPTHNFSRNIRSLMGRKREQAIS
jgi:peptidoglycan/LPS O-acetylase OafA/YrhL